MQSSKDCARLRDALNALERISDVLIFAALTSVVSNGIKIHFTGLQFNQSIYISCLWDSSGESIDNNWENNIH